VELVPYLVTPVMVFGAWLIGSRLEKRHLGQLALLESGSRNVLAITVEDLPRGWDVESCDLVMGNVVISQDYFKRVIGHLKGLVGGNIGVFEPLLERARREALLRMKAAAHKRGFDTVINVRMETSRLASSRGDGKGTAGVEILAFGTALKLRGGRPA